MRLVEKLVICLFTLFMVCCQHQTMNKVNDKSDTESENDTVSYNENWIPYAALKKNFGNKISNMKYMDSIYGKPIEIQTYAVRYGKVGDIGYEIDGVSDKISNIPKCELKTYIWKVDSVRMLIMYYILRDNNLIPIWGYQYNPDTINVE